MPATKKQAHAPPRKRKRYRRGPPPIPQQDPNATAEQVAKAVLRPLSPPDPSLRVSAAARNGRGDAE